MQDIVFSLWEAAVDAVNVLCRYLSLPHLNVDFSREDIAKIEKSHEGEQVASRKGKNVADAL